ncbi:DUF4255 domain-containing protein [Amycolatopsis vastitatis]|uniref:Pvc16 N-terminal domain-containing protein n=1 Tax=Amycolatopsis vastitatis TaxID=1905142 RepID=A0A229SY02_9PSEU|nr:DUF4255 domain-containing protein [Amycolatopsis vastitatis]OXM63534.1 hypothetical protein CF165_30500 [Amycolatopsis vastitatis]
MLHLLDESLEEFLRATVVPVAKREVDVAFAAPDKDWAAKVSRPTLNLYLWDVRRNLGDREFGVETVAGADGARYRRVRLPRVDCRYLVTAWTSDIRDEHSLLGDALAVFLRHPELESRYLRGAYQAVRPLPSIEVGAGDGRDNSDFWSALGGQLKPGLDITVTATVDSALLVPVGEPVERYQVAVTPTGSAPENRLFVGGHSAAAPGTVVSTPRGATTVGEDGTFVVAAEVGDELAVDGQRQGKVEETGPAPGIRPPGS